MVHHQAGRPRKAVEAHDSAWRELKIRDDIEKHPDWNKNDFKRYYEKENVMAPETFNRTLASMLREAKVLRIHREGHPKNRHFYVLPPDKLPLDEKGFNKAAEIIVSTFEKAVGNVISTYKSQSRVDKILLAAGLIDELFRNLNGFAWFQIEGIRTKQECEIFENRLQSLIRRVFRLIREDNDNATVFPLVKARVLPITESIEKEAKDAITRVQ